MKFKPTQTQFPMIKQIVATVYVVDQEKILLIHHRKLNKWLPPGGHLDANEIPSEAAKREVLEETGYEVELISDEHIWVERRNASSLPRPYLCLLEEIPAHGDTPAHQHIDFCYLGKVTGGSPLFNQREIQSMKWFDWEELQGLKPDLDIFEETLQVIRKILNPALALNNVVD